MPLTNGRRPPGRRPASADQKTLVLLPASPIHEATEASAQANVPSTAVQTIQHPVTVVRRDEASRKLSVVVVAAWFWLADGLIAAKIGSFWHFTGTSWQVARATLLPPGHEETWSSLG